MNVAGPLPARLPRRPVVGLALFFLAGCILGAVYPCSPWWLLGYAVPFLLGAWFTHRLAIPCLWGTILLAGWAHLATHSATPSLSSTVTLPSSTVLTGIVADEPIGIPTKNGKTAWKFPLQAETVRPKGQSDPLPATALIRMKLYAFPNERIPAYGERWSFYGYLDQATYKRGYMQGKPGSLFFTGSAPKARLMAAGQGHPFIVLCLRFRTWAKGILASGLEDYPLQHTILDSILLGYYSQIPRDLYQLFANTGTLHVFAISGSHIPIMNNITIE